MFKKFSQKNILIFSYLINNLPVSLTKKHVEQSHNFPPIKQNPKSPTSDSLYPHLI